MPNGNKKTSILILLVEGEFNKEVWKYVVVRNLCAKF